MIATDAFGMYDLQVLHCNTIIKLHCKHMILILLTVLGFSFVLTGGAVCQCMNGNDSYSLVRQIKMTG